MHIYNNNMWWLTKEKTAIEKITDVLLWRKEKTTFEKISDNVNTVIESNIGQSFLLSATAVIMLTKGGYVPKNAVCNKCFK